MSKELLDHIMDIKETLALTTANVANMHDDIKEHREEMSGVKEELDEVKDEVSELKQEDAKIKGAVRALRWVIGLCFGLPGVIFTLVKLIEAL